MKTTVKISPATPRDYGPVIDAFARVSALERELARARSRFDQLAEEYASPVIASYCAQRRAKFLKSLAKLSVALDAGDKRLALERAEFDQEELAALDA
ncbi:MAG: hypothetical protein PHU46_13695 [Rhodocyclaceae bacterium]|nr:hypothetical protein [Rhodocyclaceae bacterium]